MREIKFRAWDLYNNRMVENPYIFEKATKHNNNGNDLNPSFIFYEDWRDIDDGISRPCHIMQYTGLKDLKDIEIYEGDIIKSNSKTNFKVVFGDGSNKYDYINGWILIGIQSSIQWLLSAEGKYEIIGNIYQNPELIN
jgi:uncharacterized phage protein (TIGR01671 family)